MTRKKFIKALMGAGMPRNDAADVAVLAQDARREYSQVLPDLLDHHRQDFGNSLAWDIMRPTIIHGYGHPLTAFLAMSGAANKMRQGIESVAQTLKHVEETLRHVCAEGGDGDE